MTIKPLCLALEIGCALAIAFSTGCAGGSGEGDPGEVAAQTSGSGWAYVNLSGRQPRVTLLTDCGGVLAGCDLRPKIALDDLQVGNLRAAWPHTCVTSSDALDRQMGECTVVHKQDVLLARISFVFTATGEVTNEFESTASWIDVRDGLPYDDAGRPTLAGKHGQYAVMVERGEIADLSFKLTWD